MLALYYASMGSPVGKIYLLGTDKGLCRLDFFNKSDTEYQAKIQQEAGLAPKKDNIYLNYVVQQLNEYFFSNRKKFDCKLDISAGTPFQQLVWKTLLKIPYSQTKSYQWVAEQIGKPKACRAVGNANGQNPIAIIIPCHRVIAADGSLGGYSSGLDTKRKLLRIEGVLS